MIKRVAVLGSTGSVGRNTLDVIARHSDRLQLVGVAARSRIELLAQQLQQFQPSGVAVWDEDKADELARLSGHRRVLAGEEGLVALATRPDVDIVVIATSGRDALVPLVRAIQGGKQIALATKELLVMAGEVIMRLVREHRTNLIPIDSEHAALFQCLQGVPSDQVARLIITGSGGPFWGKTLDPASVSREQVLAHPKWRMGPKITVDSATMMNKGLEMIEARWLFDLPLERLAVLIHPEAVVHALVELIDGTVLAQMSPCDMRLPIQFALSFPERWDAAIGSRIDLTRQGPLRFMEPDRRQFPCLQLALDAAAVGGTACAVLNGANDVAVHAYLEGHLAFADIPRVIEETQAQHTAVSHPSLEELMAADEWARQTARSGMSQWSPC